MERNIEHDPNYRAFTCDECKGKYVMEIQGENAVAGYAVANDARGKRFLCFTCVAGEEAKMMMALGTAQLHLSHRRVLGAGAATTADGGQWFFTNWPNTLRFAALNPDGSPFLAPKYAQNLRARFIGPDGVTWAGQAAGDGRQAACRRMAPVPSPVRPRPVRSYIRRFRYAETLIPPTGWVNDIPPLIQSEPAVEIGRRN